MNFDELPVELRRAYEHAGLMAESETNERIKLAMLGLQNAIVSDFNKKKAVRMSNQVLPTATHSLVQSGLM